MTTFRVVACALLLASTRISNAQTGNLDALKKAFDNPPADARILMRWWWFGPAVTKTELEREMRAMKAAGIGGFEVQPVYPLALDDPQHGFRNLPYMSPEFLEALRFTGLKARELGLRMDLTLGSGWPFGGPHIPITQAAARLRIERVEAGRPFPKMGEGEKLITTFPIANGSEAPVTEVFIAGRTRQTVKRAAAGAEGFVLDHYDEAAIQNHLKTVGEPMLNALALTPPYAIFSDSLEVYNSDWTGDFIEEFRKRRGYELTPYLPALASGAGAEAPAIRHDWGKTLTELANERYLDPLRAWAQDHHTRFRSQTYGIPPVNLSSNSRVDLPEGEGWQWRHFSTTRWASSAAHLYHRPVISSETWTWLHSPAFRATPLDLKAEADLHFLEGINQLIGHGWPYSPPQVGEPGWRFYAAAALNDHNPWWLVMPDIARYLQRISFLLRQGQPATDVALYLPTADAWTAFTPGHVSLNQTLEKIIGSNVIEQILDAGYSFDFIDDEAIARGGVPYPLLVLPGVERMPLSTLRKIEEYARGGGKVFATRRTPSLAPGLREQAEDTPRIRELSRRIGSLVQLDAQLGLALRAALTPDVIRPREIGFVHRKLDFADLYFLVNTANHAVHTRATFRARRGGAQWWNPLTGKVWGAGENEIVVDLAPYESRVLVFSDGGEAKAAMPAEEVSDVSGGWTVTFSGSREQVTLDSLRSWTDLENRAYFSGVASYQRTVHVEPPRIRYGRALYLDFGEGSASEKRGSGPGMQALLDSPVREAAVVYVNGKLAGSVWCAPYEVEIGGLVHAGENTIRVLVANLAINRMAQDAPPDYSALIAKYGERFQPQDMAGLRPVPSGLLGRIRLIGR